MKFKIAIAAVVLLALSLLPAPARAGGWAVVTLEEWPEGVLAGKALTVVFSVRQHGATLASGYNPIVRAYNAATGARLEITAFETKRTGFYAAEMTFPEAGSWAWSVSYTGSPDVAMTLPALTVGQGEKEAGSAGAPAAGFNPGYLITSLGALGLIGSFALLNRDRKRGAAAAAAVGILAITAGVLLVPRVQAAASAQGEASGNGEHTALSDYEYGRILFQAKGCIVCHNHTELREGFTGIASNIGPDMSWGTKRPVEFLRTWLKDPAAVKPGTLMPNLELSEAEIEALAAFLMGELK